MHHPGSSRTRRIEWEGTGKLGLFAYSPYGGSDWTHEWREDDGSALLKRFEDILTTLKAAPPMITAQVEESERWHKEELALRKSRRANAGTRRSSRGGSESA
jgi:hypothetical protein